MFLRLKLIEEKCFQNVFVEIVNIFICPNYQIYLSKLSNTFVQIAKCICQNKIQTQPRMANVLTTGANKREMLVFDLQNVLVQIITCICPNCKCICPNYKDRAWNGKCSYGSS